MDIIDPKKVLESLETGADIQMDVQKRALQQLCMVLLTSDNVDRCFERYPPVSFIPALCKILLHETATDNILEVTACAMTYYLDVSINCARHIAHVDGAIKAICNRLAATEINNRASKELAEQFIKLLERICRREASVVYDSGGLQCVLALITQYGRRLHKDTVRSATSVITSLCTELEPKDASLPECSASLGVLIEHDDPEVGECALRCFTTIIGRCLRNSVDPVEMARHGNLIEHLLSALVPVSQQMSTVASDPALGLTSSGARLMSVDSTASAPPLETSQKPASFISLVTTLVRRFCHLSAAVTGQVVSSPLLVPALKSVLTSKDEGCLMDTLRLCDRLIVLMCEGRHALLRSSIEIASGLAPRNLIDAIKAGDIGALIHAVGSGQIDANSVDDAGQTLLNWASAFGTADMVKYLCDKGADVNKGQQSTSLHYAACFGRTDVVEILLKNGAKPELRDRNGKTALDRARERGDETHRQVIAILEHAEKMSEPEIKDSVIDPGIVQQLLEQLLPVFCDVFQRSMGTNVRQSIVPLIRNTVYYLKGRSLKKLATAEHQFGDIQVLEFGSHPTDGQKLAESIVSVIVVVLGSDDDVEGHENVLHLARSLCMKDADFWTEQLIRVGVAEKVEAIASKPWLASKGGTVTTMVFDESGNVSSTTLMNVLESAFVRPADSLHTPTIEVKKLVDSFATIVSSQESTLFRSNTTTPSVTVESLQTSEAREITGDNARATPSENGRNMMPNVPIRADGLSNSSLTPPIFGSDAPPTTVEVPAEVRSHGGNTVITTQSTGTLIGNGTVGSGAAGELVLAVQDQWEIVQGKFYGWKDWCIIKSRDSFFIWCDAAAMEFTDRSNGWFRFMLEDEVSTMYRNESPESDVDNAETRIGFIDKFLKARNTIARGSLISSIFTQPSYTTTIDVGNWIISSRKNGELTVTNRCVYHQNVIFVADFPGFLFESNENTKHCFQADSLLGFDFSTGWAIRGGERRLKFYEEARKVKVREMAKDLWVKYLKGARAKPRVALVKLQETSALVKQICFASSYGNVRNPKMKDRLFTALKCIQGSIVDERLLSTYELSKSGVVGAVFDLLGHMKNNIDGDIAGIFEKIFSDSHSLSTLVRKMVLILEMVEKFPQYLYDSPGIPTFGLQLLRGKIKFNLELINQSSVAQNQLIDRSGRRMQSEPLVTVGQLRNYILKMVVKRWYDGERETFSFFKQIKSASKAGQKISFVYSSDFDDQGLIYWLGTNGKTTNEWTNPATVRIVHVESSDGARQPFGKPENILSRDITPLSCHTSNDKNANFTIDLGVLLYPTTYTLRHARGYDNSALRNWCLQGSIHGHSWDVLVTHKGDSSLNNPGSTASFRISCPEGKGPYRYMRICQNGKNSSDQTYVLSLSGFEVYGDVVDVIDYSKPLDAKPGGILSARGRDKRTPDPTGTSSEELPLSSSGRNRTSALPSSSDRSYSHLPGGSMNNKLTAGVINPYESLSSPSALRKMIVRMNQGARGYTPGNASGTSSSLPNSQAVMLAIGKRVARGPDWQWGQQGENTEGTIISLVENGWVDVLWDNNTLNSYRFGAGGKYDLIIRPSVIPVDINMPMRSGPGGANRNPRDANQNPNSSGLPFGALSDSSAFAGRQLSPTSGMSSDHSQSSSFSSAAQTPRTEIRAETPVSLLYGSSAVERLNAAAGTSSRGARVAITGTTESLTASWRSMSSTNLFDGSDGGSRAPVRSTNRAAGAKPIHRHASFNENLLARSRMLERIPEFASEETHPSDVVRHQVEGNGSQPLLAVDEQYLRNVNAMGVSTRSSPLESVGSSAQPANALTLHEYESAMEESFANAVSRLNANLPDLGVMRQSQEQTELEMPRLSPKNVFVEHQELSAVSIDINSTMPTPEAENEVGRNVVNSTNPTVSEGSGTNAHVENDTSSASDSARRGGQSVGGDLRSLDGYADTRRSVLQRAIDSGEALNAELEGTDDDLSDFDTSSEEIYYDGEDDFDPNDSSVHALLDAAVTFSRQSSTGSSGATHGTKLNWQESLMKESSRLLAARAPRTGSSSSVQQRSGGEECLGFIWDEGFLLTTQYADLIPIFDPRPGRPIVNQTEDVELPPVVSTKQGKQGASTSGPEKKPSASIYSPFVEPSVRLYIRGPNIPNIADVTVELNDDKSTVFSFVQQIVQQVKWGQVMNRTYRVWEPTYTLIYEEASHPNNSVQTTNITANDIKKLPDVVNEVLSVLSHLHYLRKSSGKLEMPFAVFVSEKLTQKLMQQLSDSLVVSANAFPSWCEHLIYKYSCLFSLETRIHYFKASAFGTTRSLIWLQNRLDELPEQPRNAAVAAGGSTSTGGPRAEHSAYRVGRIKHERIEVPRDEKQLLKYASQVMKFHASRKSVLQIQYAGEEGTGLGPTVEFYALVAAEFQKKSLAMWICDDEDDDQRELEVAVDLGEGIKPPGYYIRRPGGLFPAALPPNGDECKRVSEHYKTLGIFLAKALQDERLVDLPLSKPFLKLLVSSAVSEHEAPKLSDVLSLKDFEEVSPMKGQVLSELSRYTFHKREIESDIRHKPQAIRRRLEELEININGTACKLEDLRLMFTVNPPSRVFKFDEMELVEGGSDIEVTPDNVELYVDKCTDFYLNTGISSQITAFREGFDMVFPLKSLRLFSPDELQKLLSGDQCPDWTWEDLVNYTEPKHGYTRDSLAFIRFVEVLAGMSPAEKKAFLQFATGCSSLPPGGLANLHPRLTVVPKVGGDDGHYPSVNTCVHYLKLPDYSSLEIMRERLIAATNEKEFYFN